jgi:hypothetical protein
VQDVEFADAKYAERGKTLDDLTKEIWMHGWLNLLTMLYYWNSGDSLVGKPAIDKWRNRRANVLKLSL